MPKVRKNGTSIRIIRVHDPGNGLPSYFISELHRQLRPINGERVCVYATVALADSEALPGTALIDVYRALIGLNEITSGGIERLLMKFFAAGIASTRR